VQSKTTASCAVASPQNPHKYGSVETPRKKIGRGYERNLDAGPMQPMVGSFELHVRAEKKSPTTIRTYVEATGWRPSTFSRPG
jgi:hypothetical protein